MRFGPFLKGHDVPKLEKQIISFFKLSILLLLTFFHKSQDYMYSSSFHIIFYLEESCFLHGGFDHLENVGYRLCESGVGHRSFVMKVLWSFDMVHSRCS